MRSRMTMSFIVLLLTVAGLAGLTRPTTARALPKCPPCIPDPPIHTPTPGPTPTPRPRPAPGPFEGTFFGTVFGDKGSHARIALVLRHRGSSIPGAVTLGTGLKVDAGSLCGGVHNAPGGTTSAGGHQQGSRSLSASTSATVDGHDVGIKVNADLSADGNTLTGQISLDLPWPCRDPKFTATLHRAS